jgi:hypothetical protein
VIVIVQRVRGLKTNFSIVIVGKPSCCGSLNPNSSVQSDTAIKGQALQNECDQPVPCSGPQSPVLQRTAAAIGSPVPSTLGGIEPGFRSWNQKYRKRGGILEQRRRPTVKFQSDFALSHDVAMRLKRSVEAPLSDRWVRGANPSTSLRKDCASHFLSNRNCGIRVELFASVPSLLRAHFLIDTRYLFLLRSSARKPLDLQRAPTTRI